MLRMMLLIVKPFMMRNVNLSAKVILPKKSVPNGPDKNVPLPKSGYKNLLLKPNVKRNLVNSVVPAVVS